MLSFTFINSHSQVSDQGSEGSLVVILSAMELSFIKQFIPVLFGITGFPQALEIMENLENHPKKFHAWKNQGIL